MKYDQQYRRHLTIWSHCDVRPTIFPRLFPIVRQTVRHNRVVMSNRVHSLLEIFKRHPFCLMHEHLSVKVRFLVAEESNILIMSSSTLDHSVVGATSLISFRPLDEYRLPFSPTLGCSLLPFEIYICNEV